MARKKASGKARTKANSAETVKKTERGVEIEGTVLRDIPIHDERLLLPRAMIAKAFGVSSDMVGKWDVTPVIKQGAKALYYLPEVVNYRQGGDGDRLDPGQEKARLDSVRREQAEIKLMKERGEIVSIDEVCDVYYDALVVVRQRMLAMPNKLARPIVALETPQEAQDVLRKEITKALEGLSVENMVEKLGGKISKEASGSSGKSAEAAPESESS